MKVAVKKSPNKYVYKLAIPLEYFAEKRAVPGTKWGMQLARNEFTAGRALAQHTYGATWSTVVGPYNQPKSFAEVRFE